MMDGRLTSWMEEQTEAKYLKIKTKQTNTLLKEVLGFLSLKKLLTA